jgi:hypothetical protein
MPDTRKDGEAVRGPRPEESLRTQAPDPAALARLFDEWMQGDEQEQRETFEALCRSLDEDRSAAYRLFPCV